MFELERMVEEAVTMDSESTEYSKLKQEVEAFIHFRPDAKVDEFMDRFLELHEDTNPLLPIMVAGKANTERKATDHWLIMGWWSFFSFIASRYLTNKVEMR